MKKIIVYLLLLLYCVLPIRAQIATFYTTDNELSSSLINAIYQDKRNYIWIATEDGLNKFDGVKFSIYKNHPDDPTSIKNNYVRSLFEDSSGRFWIGCINGVLLYNRTTDNFREIPLFHEDSLITPHITAIIESREKEIWMSTSGSGVIRIKENDTTYCKDVSLSERLSSLHLTSVFQDSRGIFWIASESQGLNRYDPVTDVVTIFKAPHAIKSDQISAICEDRNGNLYVGTLTNGLYKFNYATQTFDFIPHIDKSMLFVKTLFIDKHNRLLVGTDGQGIKILNSEKMLLEDYQMLSAQFNFSRMKVHAICQDKAGNIWTGLFQKGVFLDPENPNKFDYWGFKSYNKNIIGSGSVMSLLKDKEGTLWIGTDNHGMYKLDKRGESTHYAHSENPNSVPNIVLSMIEDERGYIWLGSYLQGLARFDKQTGRCVYFDYNETDMVQNMARNKIFCLTKDQDNKLWIGTSGAGVYVFDLVTMEYIKHYHTRANEIGEQIPNNWVNAIECDSEGTIWIGSYAGVFTLNPLTGEKQQYTKDGRSLSGNVVYCIEEDVNKNVWVGTTEGLTFFDLKNNTNKIYTIKDGLSSNVICSILEDEKRNIWLSTHSGISKLIVNEGKFVNFYASDGLQGNEFNMGAAYKDQDNQFFFGGINGITAFYPSKINDQRVPLNLFLTALYIMDKPIVAGQKSGRSEIINGFIADVDTIQLNYTDKMLTLEFSTFDFGFSGHVRYQYMLDGLNSNWLSTEPGGNRITFTNISPGVYKLYVKALIYNDSSTKKTFTLIIYPPWYLTWWAKILYVCLFLLIIWAVTHIIMDRINHRNELLRREHSEQLNETKLQFFINVSHEIRTPMTLIISPLEKLIVENKDDDKQKVYLLMYRNAQRILRLINQLMDVRKLDKGLMVLSFRETDMVGFIDDIMQTFEYQADRRSINFTFSHADKQLMVWIDLNNFDKVLVNILSNAFKFTHDDGDINIILRTGIDENESGALRNYFEIVVSDTGIGIEESKVEKIFERFYQINSNDSSTFGTGIGLHLSRSLVELLYGKIYAKNRSDRQGSEFIIRLPLGNAHLKETEKIAGTVPAIQKSKPESQLQLQEPKEKSKVAVKSKTKYRVLIVDDEDEIRNYIKEELSPLYKTSEATNGKEALEYILKEKPNLIISDVMMPEMDGNTLVKKVKANINVNHIPIILLTAKASDEDKAEGLEMGADAYISKPFNVDLLKIRIVNLLENRERLGHKATDSEENKSLIKPVVLRSSDQILYEKIIKLINENIANSDLNVEFLANGVGMSRVHMHRKLKELTNQSARDFIRSIRLKQAGELLSSQKLAVSEVAYALGFVNLSHFSNSFRDFYGMSPKEYAEQHKKK